MLKNNEKVLKFLDRQAKVLRRFAAKSAEKVLKKITALWRKVLFFFQHYSALKKHCNHITREFPIKSHSHLLPIWRCSVWLWVWFQCQWSGQV